MIGPISKGDSDDHGEAEADFSCSWTLINLGKVSFLKAPKEIN